MFNNYVARGKLKNDWLLDPCWDIEDTEGFEDHRQELYIFRLETELKWSNEELKKFRNFVKIARDIFQPIVTTL